MAKPEDDSKAQIEDWVSKGERREQRWLLAGFLAIAAGVVVVLAVELFVRSNLVPVDDKRAIDAVEASGLSHVILGAADALGCADGESSRHFSATNAGGKSVEGTACCGVTGIGKGCTIRWGR